MNDLEIVQSIKSELICRRKEIEPLLKGEEKNKALEAYTELLTTLQLDKPRTYK
ncbi:MAG: hypothetical protein OEY81_00255 [Candidatus Bathyarchaeota archaeon]|nr:hypothetical protein [Candidatus Bathyarchaeota archaeon]